MPRGEQIEQLKPSWFKPKWNTLPTATVRVPVAIGNQSRAIAQWADRQSDPVAAMQQVLEWIESQETESGQ